MTFSKMTGLRRLRRFVEDRRGGVMIIALISFPALLGMAGLAIDVSAWYLHKRVLQTIADSAALAGALEVERTGDGAAILAAARRDAQANGLNEAEGDTLTVRNPPASGPHAGVAEAVEVEVLRPTRNFVSAILLEDVFNLQGRAVASVGESNTCVWALDRSGRSAVKVSGSAQVNLGCGVLVNSSDTEALTQTGSSCLRATGLRVVGGYSGDCLEPTPKSGAAVEDPLAFLPPPSYGACDDNRKLKVNGADPVSLAPGVYCGDISVSSGGVLNFEPGIFVLDGAGLSVSGSGTVTGEGVMIYITDRARNSDRISVSGSASVTLSAATSGLYAGVLFYQDRGSTAMTHSFTGGSSAQLDGILYFPNQDVKFSGGSALSKSTTFLVVNTLTFTGNSEIGDFGESAASSSKQLISARLVE